MLICMLEEHQNHTELPHQLAFTLDFGAPKVCMLYNAVVSSKINIFRYMSLKQSNDTHEQLDKWQMTFKFLTVSMATHNIN